ncbi:hypothetical protein LJC59_04200 [Desulfovibrio sp. OttesenSCG-928-A18]|nr:hypothetical protein [Desulfovibrio sp. OttesenSCG-928-A18]
MVASTDHILPLYDSKGALHSIMLSAELWNRYGYRLEPLLRRILEDMEPKEREEPLQDWEDFKAYWDFKYPICADVECGNCGARTEDWTQDPAKPFRLKSAQLGGLAVFSCRACGATVRKKHFKDHICFEYSLGNCGC